MKGEIWKMKKMISKAVCIKNITVFSFVTLTCVLVLSVFVVKLMEDLEEGSGAVYTWNKRFICG